MAPACQLLQAEGLGIEDGGMRGEGGKRWVIHVSFAASLTICHFERGTVNTNPAGVMMCNDLLKPSLNKTWFCITLLLHYVY